MEESYLLEFVYRRKEGFVFIIAVVYQSFSLFVLFAVFRRGPLVVCVDFD
jgi:hypothetical protein